jgi:hypothetical protein
VIRAACRVGIHVVGKATVIAPAGCCASSRPPSIGVVPCPLRRVPSDDAVSNHSTTHRLPSEGGKALDKVSEKVGTQIIPPQTDS